MALAWACVITLPVALSGCAEKPQTSGRKIDGHAWDAPANGFAAPGYKPGDQLAWEEQIRRRGQSQNEYSRAVTPP